MRSWKRIVATSVLLLSVPAAWLPAHAALLDRAGVYVDAWSQSLTGNARIDGAEDGDTFSLTRDAGLDGKKVVGEVGAWFHPFGRHRLRVSGLSMSLDGRTTLARSIRVGDLTLPAGTPVGSALDLKLYKAHYSYSIVNRDLVNVALLAGADFVDGQGEIRGLDVPETAALKGAVPVLGASVQVSPLGFFRMYGEITGANWKVGSVRAKIGEALVRAEVYAFHFLGFGAGYRKLRIEAEKTGEGKIDVTTDGYQLYLLFRF